MPKCFVKSCKNQQIKKTLDRDFNLHVFPKSPRLIRQWLIACGHPTSTLDSTVVSIIEKHKNNNFRMCSDHFTEESYRTIGVKKLLKFDAVPSLFERQRKPSRAVASEITQSPSHQVSSTPAVQSTSSAVLTFGDVPAEASTSETDSRPSKRKRFMDHDYTAESTEYSFGNFVNEWTNTESLKTSNKYCQCKHSAFCQNIKTQTSALFGKKNAKTSTVEITRKDAETWTGDDLELDTSIDDIAFGIDTSTPLKEPHTSSKKSLFTAVVTPLAKSNVADMYETQSSMETTQQAMQALADDPNYEPETEVSMDLSDLEDLTVDEIVADTKFIVFQSCLDQLLKFINVCNYNGKCGSPIIEKTKSITGTLLVIYATCENDHTTEVWRSQPMLGRKAAGNVLCSAAVLFSGSHFSKVEEFFNILGTPFIHKTSYYVNQNNHMFPVIAKHYKEQYQAIVSELKDKTICVSGDGQCDSPGYSARYNIYSMTEENSNKIIECEVVEVSETTSSTAMEKLAFERCVERIQGNGLDIGIIATDRHVGIRSMMQKKFSEVRHEFDIWHYAKSLNKRLLALCKKKNCKELVPWREAIVKHFWTSSCTCKGNVDLLVEKWNSILRHITNEHLWPNGILIHGCNHPELDDESKRERQWLDRASFAYGQLSKLVLDKSMQKDLQHMAHFCHTGNIEVFHSMALKYRPKRVHFTIDGMIARTQLAVLHHNNNVNRPKATIKKSTAKSGDLGEVRYEPFYSKRSKTWKVKVVYEKTTIGHIYKMLFDLGRKVNGEIDIDWVSRTATTKKSIARTQRPCKSDLVLAHLPRIHAQTTNDE